MRRTATKTKWEPPALASGGSRASTSRSAGVAPLRVSVPSDDRRMAARRGALWVADRVDDVRRRERLALLLTGDDRLGCRSLALEPVAERTLATQSWREEIDRWYDDERPLVLAAEPCVAGRGPRGLGDAELAGHIDRAIAHFAAVAPLHFEHAGFDIAIGLLLRATAEWGIERRRGRRVACGCVTRHIGGAQPPRPIVRRPRLRAPTSLDVSESEVVLTGKATNGCVRQCVLGELSTSTDGE